MDLQRDLADHSRKHYTHYEISKLRENSITSSIKVAKYYFSFYYNFYTRQLINVKMCCCVSDK